MSVQIQSKTVF